MRLQGVRKRLHAIAYDRARWIALDGACMRQNPATDVRRRVTGLDGALMLLECARGRSRALATD